MTIRKYRQILLIKIERYLLIDIFDIDGFIPSCSYGIVNSNENHPDIPRLFHQIPTKSRYLFHEITITYYNITIYLQSHQLDPMFLTSVCVCVSSISDS